MERKLLVSLSKSVEGDWVKDLIEEEIVLLGLKVHEKGQQNDGTWGWMIGYQSQADKISIKIQLKKLQDKYNSKLSIKQQDQQTQTKVSQKGNINEQKSQGNKKDAYQQDMNKNNEQKEKDKDNDSFDQLSESSDEFQVLDNGKSIDQEKSEGFEGDEQEMKRQGDVLSPKQQNIQMEQVVELVQLGSQSAQQQSIAQEIQQEQHSQENQNIEKQMQKAEIVKAQQHEIKPVIKDQQTKHLDQQTKRQKQELKIENDENDVNKEDIDRVDDTTEVLIKYYQQKQYKQRLQLQYQRKQKEQDKQVKQEQQEQQNLISSQSLKYINDQQQQVVALPQQQNQQIVTVDENRDQYVKQKQKQSKQQQSLSQKVQTKQIYTNHNKGEQLININIDSRQQYDLLNSRQEDINQQMIKKKIGGQESIQFKIKYQLGENKDQHQDKQQKQQQHQQQKQQQHNQPTQYQPQQNQHHHQQTELVNKPIISIDYQYLPISTQPAFNQHLIHHPSEKDQLINTEQQFSQQLVLDESCHQLLSKNPINLSHQQPKADLQLHRFQSYTYQHTSQDSLQLSENSLTYINQPQQQHQTINQSTNKQFPISTSQQQQSQSSKQSLSNTTPLQYNKQRRQPLINKALLQMKNMQPSSTIQMIEDKQQSDRLYPVQNSTSTNISNTNNPSKTLKRSLLQYNNQAQTLSTLSLSYYNNQRYVIMCLLAGVLVLMCYLFYL